MLELFKSRRSVRKFTSEPISKEHLDKILKSALLAPTGKNAKPLEYIVLENTETIKALVKCKKNGANPLLESPLAIVILGDTNKSDIWMEDAAIAATFMQLEIEDLGLGSCWIHYRVRTDENGVDSDTLVRKLLNYPEHLNVLCALAIGHKNEEKPAYTDDYYDFSKIHYEKY